MSRIPSNIAHLYQSGGFLTTHCQFSHVCQFYTTPASSRQFAISIAVAASEWCKPCLCSKRRINSEISVVDNFCCRNVICGTQLTQKHIFHRQLILLQMHQLQQNVQKQLHRKFPPNISMKFSLKYHMVPKSVQNSDNQLLLHQTDDISRLELKRVSSPLEKFHYF